MPPVTTSGRAGRGEPGPDGLAAGGASAETPTKPILTTLVPGPKQARRTYRRDGKASVGVRR
jgi:hypothetical protein